MTYQQIYKSHYARVVRDNVLKSAIFGLLAGLAVAAVIAFITIFTEFNGLWTAIGSGLGVAAVTAVVLYFTLFRPTDKSVAEQLDRLGFDERIITMLELNGNDSVMAELQRKNAVATVTAVAEKNGGKVPVRSATVMQKLAALGLNTTMLIIAGVVVAFAVVSLVFTGLPTKTVKEMFVGTPTYTVTYNAGEHGYILTESGDIARDGKYTIRVNEGKLGETIVIVANDGFMFAGWSDGYYDEYNASARTDKVMTGFTATAQYKALDVVEDDPEESLNSADGENPGAGNGNAPMKEGEGSQNNPGQIDPMAPPGTGAGASDTPMYSEIMDGNTDYQEFYDQFYNDAMQRLAEGHNIPDSLRKMIAAYFAALK